MASLYTAILGNEEHSNKVLKCWDALRKWLILLRKKRHYVFVPLVPQKLNLAVWFYVCRRWVFPLKPSVVIISHRIRSSRKCALLNIYISDAVSTRNNCCAVYAFQELCVSRKGNVDGWWGGVRGSSPPAGRRNWIYSFISQVLLKMFTVAEKSCLGFGFLVMCSDDDYEIRNPIGK